MIEHEHLLFDNIGQELAIDLASSRREWVKHVRPTELVANILPGQDHRTPMPIGDQLIDIKTTVGEGKLPVTASHRLDEGPIHGITKLYIVQCGILGNSIDYYKYCMEALGESFDETKTLVVSSQFPRDVDGVGEGILRWGYRDARDGEPALEPGPPIGAYDAKDALVRFLIGILPDLEDIILRDNSAGGQMDYRWIMTSYVLKQAEVMGISIEAALSNPGSVLYPEAVRPVFVPDPWNRGRRMVRELVKIPENSPANQWPYGRQNAPPGVERYFKRHPLKTILRDFVGRMILCGGELDNDPRASQLQIGEGAAAQGATRNEKLLGIFAYLLSHHQADPEMPLIRWHEFAGVGHDGAEMLKRIEEHYALSGAELAFVGNT